MHLELCYEGIRRMRFVLESCKAAKTGLLIHESACAYVTARLIRDATALKGFA